MRVSGGNRYAVAIRTVGTRAAGLGHVRRCLTLAVALQDVGGHVEFWLDTDEDSTAGTDFNAGLLVRRAGFTVRRTNGWQLPVDAPDVLVADAYDVSPEFIKLARTKVPLVVAIEDLADRVLPADIVVSVGAAVGGRDARYPSHTTCLFGFPYALLESEVSDRAEPSPSVSLRRLLITVGVADHRRLVPRLMRWASDGAPDFAQDVVVGPFFDNTREIEAQASTMTNVSLWHQPLHLATLMRRVDLAVAGGGQTLIELMGCGTPTAVVTLYDNQLPQVEALSRCGAIACAGRWDDSDLGNRVSRTLRSLIDPTRRTALSRAARHHIDGKGAKRVADVVTEQLQQVQS